MLHLAELPLCAVFTMINGGNEGPSSFSGPVGQLCDRVDVTRSQVKFEPIPFEVNVPEAVAESVSREQRIFLEYCKGVNSGKVEPRYARMKIGPLCHSLAH